LIARKMREFGFDKYESYEFAPNRLNSWGMLKGTGGGCSLLLQAHVDTVGIEGWKERWKGTLKEDPFSGALIDGEIWGRGSIDCKAGMAASLIACKALKEAGVLSLAPLILILAVSATWLWFNQDLAALTIDSM